MVVCVAAVSAKGNHATYRHSVLCDLSSYCWVLFRFSQKHQLCLICSFSKNLVDVKSVLCGYLRCSLIVTVDVGFLLVSLSVTVNVCLAAIGVIESHRKFGNLLGVCIM